MIRSDFSRVFCGKRFYFSILAVLGIIFLSLYPEAEAVAETASLYYLLNVRHGLSLFFTAMAGIAAVPFSMSYVEDKKNNYIYGIESRKQLCIYGISHVIVTAVSAFLTVFLGYLLFSGLALLKMPLLLEEDMVQLIDLAERNALTAYEKILLTDYSAWYCVFIAASEGLGYAFMAVVVLLCSVRIRNTFVLLSIPLIFYYGSSIFISLFELPTFLRWFSIMENGLLGNLPESSAGTTLVITAGYFLALICIAGLIFVFRMEKRVRNG